MLDGRILGAVGCETEPSEILLYAFNIKLPNFRLRPGLDHGDYNVSRSSEQRSDFSLLYIEYNAYSQSIVFSLLKIIGLWDV